MRKVYEEDMQSSSKMQTTFVAAGLHDFWGVYSCSYYMLSPIYAGRIFRIFAGEEPSYGTRSSENYAEESGLFLKRIYRYGSFYCRE